ncbi:MULTISPECIES: hypothetical protein [unclassified Yoonia]|uniref:DUF7742 family protein n=1 Tax=unclassified Yoonia TaxID=2629118 RepID=UPI002B0012CA|nr:MULTISPECIES: hypothetical protein [unclassified Yoonia]
MRGLQLADLELATRALLLLPASDRAPALDRMLQAARLGAAHHAINGTAHPAHGTGTLMSALSRLPIAPRPPVLTRDYLHCLAFVAITIRDLTDDTFDIGERTLFALQRTP